MDTSTPAELRRQKILANAEARLRKIKRITFEDVEREPEGQKNIHPQRLVNETEVEERGFSCQPTFLSKNPGEVKNETNVTPFISDQETKQSKPIVNGNICNGLNDNCDDKPPDFEYVAQRNNSEIKLEPDSTLFENARSTFALSQKIKRQKYNDLAIFMFLGILVRFVCFIGLSSLFLNNILGPFLVVCLPRIVVYIRQKPELSIIYTLMLFMGIQENRVKMPLRVLYCLRTAVQYLALYLFSFFLTHCIIKEI